MRTSKKKFRVALASLKDWLGKNRCLPLKVLAVILRHKFIGYYNYYGVIGNSRSLWRFWNESRRIIFRKLNRRLAEGSRRLRPVTKRRIDAANRVYVSAISAWEISLKAVRGQLVLPIDVVFYRTSKKFWNLWRDGALV